MQKRYWTFGEVIRALGTASFEELKLQYDPKRIAREKRLDMKPGPCAGCGREAGPANKKAHILPVAEGWPTTDDNIIWLCERPGKQTASGGCHWLFDHGYASANEITAAKSAEGEAAFQLGPQLRSRYKDFGPSPRESGHYRKWQEALTAERKGIERDYATFAKLTIEIAECSRRRPTEDSLKRALSILDNVTPGKIDDHHLLARYYYERGYIFFLQGGLSESRKLFETPLDKLEDYESNPASAWRWAAHRAMITQIDLLLAQGDPPAHAKGLPSFRDELIEVLKVVLRADGDLNTPDPWNAAPERRRDRAMVGRWVQNMLHDLCRIEVLMGNKDQSLHYLTMALDRWKDRHLANGWESPFKPLLVSLRGHVQLLRASCDSDVREAVGYLVRALVMFRGQSQQPEGTADILRGIGNGLTSLEDCKASVCCEVAGTYRDVGSWGLWAR